MHECVRCASRIAQKGEEKKHLCLVSANRKKTARLSERRRSMIRRLTTEGVARLHSLRPEDRTHLLAWLPRAMAEHFAERQYTVSSRQDRLIVVLLPIEK